MSNRSIFGAIVAMILVTFYSYLFLEAISALVCKGEEKCIESKFGDQAGLVLTMINALLAGVVVAELTLTKPLSLPSGKAIEMNPGRVSQVITWIYFLAWAVGGVWALVVSLKNPTYLPTLTKLAQAWVGTAVAGAYAYFGIQPPSAKAQA